MSNEKNLLSAADADKLLASADGTAALLYLHMIRSGTLSIHEAARVLRRSEADVALAADTLRRLGLTSREAPLPQHTLPELTTRDLQEIAVKDPAFQGLVSEAEKALGRVLSENDLRILFGMYDSLGLPADVIMLLLHYCIEEYQQRNGSGRMPTMRFIEKEGWHWAEEEILNLDAAEIYLQNCRARHEATEQVKEVLEIRGRSLTASEKKYIDAWLSMGFGPDALAIAYDRTVLRTKTLTWKYMDSIVRSWDEKHLHTPEEIEAGDPAQRSKRTKSAGTAGGDDEKMKQMQKMLEHMKKHSGKEEG